MHPTQALLELLLPTLLATTPARSSAPVPSSADEPHVVEVEIVEKPEGGKRARTRMSVPANGKLEAWVEGGARRRECKLESHHDASRGELTIDLRCREQGSPEELAIWARPLLTRGKRTTLASIDRQGGGSIEINATLR